MPNSPVFAYEIDRIRADFPSLASGWALFDGPGGTQTPRQVIAAIAAALEGPIANRGAITLGERNAESTVIGARQAIADLVNGDPRGVVFGRSATQLAYDFSRLLSASWLPGDEIIVTRLDHDSNVRPWVQAAESAGATVRWAEIDLETGELPADQYKELVNGRTKVVAVTAASNVLGTKPDISRIAEIAHSAGAFIYVDGVHATPHFPIDINAMSADFYMTSAYKWQGPHIAALAADPKLLQSLTPRKLASSTPDSPNKYELGTPPFADLAGVSAAVDHMAGLEGSSGTRRERITASMTSVAAFQKALAGHMLDSLRAMPKVHVIGKLKDKTPTAYFTVAGYEPLQVAQKLSGGGVNVWNGHNYAWEVTAALGIRDKGSAVRAGLSLYNNEDDVERLLKIVGSL